MGDQLGFELSEQEIEEQKILYQQIREQHGNNIEQDEFQNWYSSNLSKQKHKNQNLKKFQNQAAGHQQKEENEGIQYFVIEQLDVENELKITEREIEFILERTNRILKRENLEELQTLFVQVQTKVDSLYDTNRMIANTQNVLDQFYKQFEKAIEDSSTKQLIFNQLLKFLNSKYSKQLSHDMAKLMINIINRCISEEQYLVNEMGVVNQFQQFIIKGIIQDVNGDIFRCVEDKYLDKIICEAFNDYKKGYEQQFQQVQLSQEMSQNNSQMQQENNQIALDNENNHNAVPNLNGALDYIENDMSSVFDDIEKRLFNQSMEIIRKFCRQFFDTFCDNITNKIEKIYDESIKNIKIKLNTAREHLQKVLIEKKDKKQHQIHFQNHQYKSSKQDYLKQLIKSIYFKKTQQILKEIIQDFEQLNNLVNHEITTEINNALKVFDDKYKDKPQPLLFNNLFEEILKRLITIFSKEIIPQTLKEFIEDKKIYTNFQLSICDSHKNEFEEFLTKPEQQKTLSMKKVLDTKDHFNLLKNSILEACNKSQEWQFYFIHKMSELNFEQHTKNHYLLMLYQISYGKITELGQDFKIKENSLKKLKEKIKKGWDKNKENIRELKMKTFEIEKIDSDKMINEDANLIGQISLFLRQSDEQFQYNITYQNLQFSSTVNVQNSKRKEFNDILNWMIHKKEEYAQFLTLFFFYHNQQLQNKEITASEFFSPQFQDYIHETVFEIQYMNTLFSFSDLFQDFNYYNIYSFVHKPSENIEELDKNIETFKIKQEQCQSNLQLYSKELHYFQSYINKDFQLTAFYIGNQQGQFLMEIENNSYQFLDNKYIQMKFSNYYTQYLFTDTYNEQALKNNITMLFYHFLIFVYSEYQTEQIIKINQELINKFKSFIDCLKSTLPEVQQNPSQFQSLYSDLQNINIINNNDMGQNERRNEDQGKENEEPNQMQQQQIQPLYSCFKNLQYDQQEGDNISSNNIEQQFNNNNMQNDQEQIQSNQQIYQADSSEGLQDQQIHYLCKQQIQDLENNLKIEQDKIKIQEELMKEYQQKYIFLENKMKEIDQQKEQMQLISNNSHNQNEMSGHQSIIQPIESNLEQDLQQQIQKYQQEMKEIYQKCENYKNQYESLKIQNDQNEEKLKFQASKLAEYEILKQSNQLCQVQSNNQEIASLDNNLQNLQLNQQSSSQPQVLVNDLLNPLKQEIEQFIHLQNNIQNNSLISLNNNICQNPEGNEQFNSNYNNGVQQFQVEDQSETIKLLRQEIKNLSYKIARINAQMKNLKQERHSLSPASSSGNNNMYSSYDINNYNNNNNIIDQQFKSEQLISSQNILLKYKRSQSQLNEELQRTENQIQEKSQTLTNLQMSPKE